MRYLGLLLVSNIPPKGQGVSHRPSKVPTGSNCCMCYCRAYVVTNSYKFYIWTDNSFFIDNESCMHVVWNPFYELAFFELA